MVAVQSGISGIILFYIHTVEQRKEKEIEKEIESGPYLHQHVQHLNPSPSGTDTCPHISIRAITAVSGLLLMLY